MWWDLFFSIGFGIRRGRPHRRWGKKHAGGMFFSPGENPLISERIRYGCERKSIVSQQKHNLKRIPNPNRFRKSIHPIGWLFLLQKQKDWGSVVSFGITLPPGSLPLTHLPQRGRQEQLSLNSLLNFLWFAIELFCIVWYYLPIILKKRGV